MLRRQLEGDAAARELTDRETDTLRRSVASERGAKAAERQIQALRQSVAEQAAARETAERQAEALRQRVVEEASARIAAQREAEALSSSSSWRLTRPLRATITTARRLARAVLTRRSAAQASPDLSASFDRDWYLSRYPDVAESGTDALLHYLTAGAAEGRDPCSLFGTVWYREQNPDVEATGVNPLEHYVRCGAAELRDPHPDFNARFYVDEHPEAAGNPLLHYLQVGRAKGWPTRPQFELAKYLPSALSTPAPPHGIEVDIIVPVYRGLEETRRCIESVLSDPERPPGRIVVVDDCSPEPGLSQWLQSVADRGAIMLLRNERNLGFVASVKLGKAGAGRRDVVLLNSDTEVPPGWLARLMGHAHSAPRIGTVTPFSNNATICSYPAPSGALPPGRSLAAIDAACRAANAGRTVEIPTAIGFCMYIRRECLDAVGPFDEETFGRGYGEENDFSMRAAALGWPHLLACDTFVYHAGEVSFGPDSPERARASAALLSLHPGYSAAISRYTRRDPAIAYRFAATAALFRAAAEPTILLVSHNRGGGSARHVSELIAAVGQRANMLLLLPGEAGLELSVPSLPDHPVLRLRSNDKVDDFVAFLRSAAVRRVHVQHLIDLDIDLRELIDQLGVPFDVTVHDYFPICPQIHLSDPSGVYCGEPDPAECNACIARYPSYNARDIVAWRRSLAWLLEEADRVICPSEDVRRRFARYFRQREMVVAPHEPMDTAEWRAAPPPLRADERLRVGLLGMIGPNKGRHTLLACAVAADPALLDFVVIGVCGPRVPPVLRGIITETGPYKEEELPALIAKAAPQVLWFPAASPETYSYVLSAAIASGLPIVASRLGAFPERLAGRPWTWLVDPDAPTSVWLDAFAAAREALLKRQSPATGALRARTEPFYPAVYLRPALGHRGSPRSGTTDLRRSDGRITVALLPERFPDGGITPSGYIRLLLPLDHLSGTHPAGPNVALVDLRGALRRVADMLVCQRHAIPDIAAAERVIAHCRSNGMRLLYDLDDDLVDVPDTHSEAERLRRLAPVVIRMLIAADVVWVSTRGLQRQLAGLRPDARVMPNRLDERLWGKTIGEGQGGSDTAGPVRILFLAVTAPDTDLELVESLARQLRRKFGSDVSFEVVGVTERAELGPALHPMQPPPSAAASYPGCVEWLRRERRWHIGVAPLVDSDSFGSASATGVLHYAALGLAVVASDVEAHRDGGLGEAEGVRLVPNDEGAWYAALADLVRDARERRLRGAQARAAFLEAHTLAAQAQERCRALADAAGTESRLADVPILDLRQAVAAGRVRVGRELLAAAFLCGEGIEISAAGIRVCHMDAADHHGLRKDQQKPHSVLSTAAEPADDGEGPGTLAAESQDFVVVNRGLERRGDLPARLENYIRAIRSEGAVFMSVPDDGRTIDQIRELLLKARTMIALPFQIELLAACDHETVIVLRRTAPANNVSQPSGAVAPSHELGGV